MPQFDVFRTARGDLLLDCQSDALGELSTRLVAPLIRVDQAPERKPRLNPVFDIDGEPHVMVTQFSAAVAVGEMHATVASLAQHRLAIVGAFDMLLTGV